MWSCRNGAIQVKISVGVPQPAYAFVRDISVLTNSPWSQVGKQNTLHSPKFRSSPGDIDDILAACQPISIKPQEKNRANFLTVRVKIETIQWKIRCETENNEVAFVELYSKEKMRVVYSNSLLPAPNLIM